VVVAVVLLIVVVVLVVVLLLVCVMLVVRPCGILFALFLVIVLAPCDTSPDLCNDGLGMIVAGLCIVLVERSLLIMKFPRKPQGHVQWLPIGTPEVSQAKCRHELTNSEVRDLKEDRAVVQLISGSKLKNVYLSWPNGLLPQRLSSFTVIKDFCCGKSTNAAREGRKFGFWQTSVRISQP